jgi:hypothetical protein
MSMLGPTDDELLDDDPQRRAARIASPGVSSSMPAVTLRGLGPVGSTNDLESKGFASHIAPAPIAKPSALETRRAADEAEYQRKLSTGSGISQIGNRFARGALRGLETIGSIVSPAAAMLIPGTELHHQALLDQDREHIGEDVRQQQEEATTGKTEADSKEAESRAHLLDEQAKVAGDPKTGLTPEETTIHDLMTGENGAPRINPQTKQPYTYLEAYTAMQQAKQDVKPDKVEKPDSPEQQFIDEYQRTHKGATVSQAVAAYAAATAKPEKSGAASARSDKSYTYNNDKLDKLGKPIEDAVARMGRLRETLAQGSPQADALVAPELLTIMAGGAGSGLRMNEAEISRIVGGRSKWETLKASINQWQLDPTKANSITPDQRQEIRSLVEAVNSKLMKKQQALDEAREGLLNSDDPTDHRRIVTNAHHALTQVDEAAGTEGGGAGGTIVSLAKARQLPQNQGKTDAEIRKDIESHGHRVTD